MKDNNNLLDYNQWCADYDKNENIFYHGAGMKVQCSNEISSIGENSFKIIKIGTTQLWAEVRKTSNNTQFTGVIDVYNPNNNSLDMRLQNNNDISEVVINNIPVNKSFNQHIISFTPTSNSIRLLFVSKDIGVWYVDDINITVS